MLDSRDLKLIEAVARLGSLTLAGRELHLTPSALSHQLAGLERRLGMPLFSRSGKRMVPTLAAERLRDAALLVLASISQAVEDARSMGTRRSDPIRLSTECYTCYHWLPGVLRDFSREFPELDVRIVAEATQRPIPALLGGNLDVAIISTPVRDRRIVTTTLFEDEIVAVVPPQHPWTQRRWVDASDFATERLVSITEQSSVSDLFAFVLEPAGVAPRSTVNIHFTEGVIELVKAEMGVAALPLWAVAPHVVSGELRTVRILSTGLCRTWSAAALRSRMAQPTIRAFIDALRRWTPTSPILAGAADRKMAGRLT